MTNYTLEYLISKGLTLVYVEPPRYPISYSNFGVSDPFTVTVGVGSGHLYSKDDMAIPDVVIDSVTQYNNAMRDAHLKYEKLVNSPIRKILRKIKLLTDEHDLSGYNKTKPFMVETDIKLENNLPLLYTEIGNRPNLVEGQQLWLVDLNKLFVGPVIVHHRYPNIGYVKGEDIGQVSFNYYFEGGFEHNSIPNYEWGNENGVSVLTNGWHNEFLVNTKEDADIIIRKYAKTIQDKVQDVMNMLDKNV